MFSRKNLLAIQSKHLAQELSAKHRIQLWILGVGVFALIFFVFHSLLMAYKVAKPITEAKEQLALQAEELTAKLSTVYDKLKVTVDQLKAAKEIAEGAKRARSDFLANMSRELRPPLNHIFGFTELVVTKHFGDLNASQEGYLYDVLSSSQHLLTLVNDILSLAKVGAGKLELKSSSVDLKWTFRPKDIQPL